MLFWRCSEVFVALSGHCEPSCGIDQAVFLARMILITIPIGEKMAHLPTLAKDPPDGICIT
ncbi:hypothetical protein [Alcanivorax quisquiliarum]|uniref:Uncharacterized protein n=1 Tax=Alcanivorax quisquiliarum TaxID=2933565 RepID=A0ABT0E938_9GAMM|nr:hypothetical protein [Alcanivorax quisquiliarum]MCK0538366.1 hypothetical protein [Alcanivorax quisquiliarum]